MFKKNNFLNNKKKITPAKYKLVTPVETNKTTCQRNEHSDYLAEFETKAKPPPKITKHESVFDK